MESPPLLLPDSGPSRFGVTRPPSRWALLNLVAGGEYGLRLWLQPLLFITPAAAFICYSFDIINTNQHDFTHNNVNVAQIETQTIVPTSPATTAVTRQRQFSRNGIVGRRYGTVFFHLHNARPSSTPIWSHLWDNRSPQQWRLPQPPLPVAAARHHRSAP